MSMTDGFAGGMTNMEGTCGALIGADMVLGLVNKDKTKTMKCGRSCRNLRTATMPRSADS